MIEVRKKSDIEFASQENLQEQLHENLLADDKSMPLYNSQTTLQPLNKQNVKEAETP